MRPPRIVVIILNLYYCKVEVEIMSITVQGYTHPACNKISDAVTGVVSINISVIAVDII